MKTILLSIMLLSFCELFAQNKALTFVQLNNNYIITPNNAAINITNNFTIEFWIQPSKVEIWAVLLQEGKCSNSSSSYNVAMNTDSTISFTFNCNGNCNYANSYKCSTKIYPGACLHVAISYSTSGVNFYFNGLLQPGQYTTGSYCGNLKSSIEPLQIGVYKFLNESLGSYYDGLIDELRIWGRVLTPSEILANYRDTLMGNEAELRLYYKFDNSVTGTGNTVNNYAAATGSALNGLTYSVNSTSPFTSYSCFAYTESQENSLNSGNYNVYPNPTKGKITVFGENIKKIEIYNVLGEKIQNISKLSTTNEIDLSCFQKGIYFVKIYSEKKFKIEKIVKQ